MDIVQQTYGLNQNDQVSNEHHQISRYVDMTANNSTNSTMDSLNSPQTELIVSNDKLKQNFSQIQSLSNSFNSILSDKENLNYFDQSSNHDNSHNKSLSINSMENSGENNHFSHSSVNPPSSLSSPSSSSSSSPSLHNLHQHHHQRQQQQTNDDNFDGTDKDEHGIRRKRRKQTLPQQNFQFTPLIINTDGIQLIKSSEKDETTDITDCDVIDITDTGCPQKVRKLSGSFVDDSNNNDNSENKEQIIEGDDENDKLDIMMKRYDENESKANKIINQSLSPNLLMSSECNKLINELSHCAVEVFRRSLNSKSTKVQINLTDEGDNRDTNCDTTKSNIIEEKMIEQTLLKLEPHISELVGQSLRSSIETLKNEMFASLKCINMNSNEDKHLIEKLTVDKNHGKPKDSNEAGIRNTATTIEHSVDKFTNDAIKTSSPIIQNQINLTINQSSSEEDLKQSLTFENLQMEQFDPSSLYQHDENNKEVFQNSTENDCATIISSTADSPSISTLTTEKTFSPKGLLGFPVDSLTENSVINNSNTDANIISNTQNGYISSNVMTDFNEQIKKYINEIKQKFPQFSTIFPCENEDSTIFPKTVCNDLSAGNINQLSSSTQFTTTTTTNDNNNNSNDISSDQPNDITSVEKTAPFTLNATMTSSSTLCSSPLPPTPTTAATPAAAAAALANVLGFPNPFGWPSKLLTSDTQDNFGLTNSLSNLWPWKLLNSSYALKCPDQNTLIQPNPLINNAINLFSQLNKVNADPTLTNCLNSKFSSNQEGKCGNNENSSLPLTTPIVTTLDEQLEAMPLVVRHERKANKTNSSTINNNTTYNSSNANSFDKLLSSITTGNTTSNTTVTPTTGITSMNETGIFHGSTIGRRRRTKVTDTRLTHSRVSRYSSNAVSNCLLGNSSGIHQAVYQQQQQHSSFPQTTTGVIDLGTAMNLITPTTNGVPMCPSGGKALQLDDKESSLLNNNLLTGLNLSKYRHFINTSINNNSNNMKLDDFTSVKYRSENQIHSSGSNNSSPSPISLRLSGNAKELVDTDGNRLNQEAEKLDGQLPGESEKSTEYNNDNNNNINNNDRLNDKHSPHDYESFERIFTKTFKNYPLSMKSNLTNNSGAVSGGISSPLSSTSSPIHFNNTNILLTETNVNPPISSISTSIMSPSSSVSMSDINQRRILSKFNPICLLNSRLSNPLPPIPPIFFDSADDILNKSMSNNATQRPSMNITNDNVHSYLGVQNEGPENQNPQQQSFSQRTSLSNCPNSSHSLASFIHNSTSSYSLPLKSPLFPISQSLSLSPLDTSSNFTNTTTATIPGNTYESSINSNTSCITAISNLQNSHHRRQQQQSQSTPSNSNPHAQHNHHHMNYINKLYDKLNSGDNLFNMKINKTMLLSDSFNNESNGMTLSESYQNQLINCSHELRMTTTLTPVHLRKAKLMFFYTRYPNSTLIKMYFPDVKFYKNNTAQLVKWFSNFREFYYIQMEKYARVAISEGIRTAEEIHVTTESEIYRALNLHYNRNQQLEVPDHFRIVVEATLREFFVALYTGKDSEQSWKKPIYKVIARMDQPVPEFFKSPNWMDQLADG